MRRWTLRILLCLILGAITTVAVAWGIGALSKSDGSGDSRLLQFPATDPAWLMSCEAGFGRFLQRTFPMKAFMAVGPANFELPPANPPQWSLARRSPGKDVDEEFAEMASGLPLLAMRARYEFAPGATSGTLISGFNLSERGLRSDEVHNWRLLPLRPIWPGFVIDTLFYGAIWFGVFFGFASAKRAIRRKRGRCPRCGYDLRGALEKGCSECGWRRIDAIIPEG